MICVYIICAKTEVEQARGEKSSVHDELALEKDEYVGGMDGDFANNYDDVGFAMEEDNGAGIGGGLIVDKSISLPDISARLVLVHLLSR